MNQQHEELKVFISSRKSSCDECGENLGSKAWITLIRDKGALCLACADLDHLSFVKYSGRVGRSASAKSLADEAVRLAVIATFGMQKQTTIRCWRRVTRDKKPGLK